MLTTRQMRAGGLERRDYASVVISQRRWAAGNPGAVYREPLTLDEYLGALPVADPLCRYDCPPGVAGADALIVTTPAAATAARSAAPHVAGARSRPASTTTSRTATGWSRATPRSPTACGPAPALDRRRST